MPLVAFYILSLMPQLFYFQTKTLSFCFHISIAFEDFDFDFDFEDTFSLKNLLLLSGICISMVRSYAS